MFWVFFFFFFFQTRVSPCNSGCPETHEIGQTDLKPRDLLASTSGVLGLNEYVSLHPAEIYNE